MDIIKKVINAFKIKIYNIFLPNEDITSNKKKWDTLAQNNSKFFTWTEKEDATEKEFRDSGLRDYTNLIKADSILQAKLDSINATSVLEIGCGIGRITEFFIQDFEEVYGIDISRKMVELAKQRLPLKEIHFIENDGKTIPLKSEIIDFVFSHATFHHMPSYKVVEENFSEIFRVLKRGGSLRFNFEEQKLARKIGFTASILIKN
ncbi:MAG: class I SAM-dependent methyltransferase [Patescibacteria group bacterium]